MTAISARKHRLGQWLAEGESQIASRYGSAFVRFVEDGKRGPCWQVDVHASPLYQRYDNTHGADGYESPAWRFIGWEWSCVGNFCPDQRAFHWSGTFPIFIRFEEDEEGETHEVRLAAVEMLDVDRHRMVFREEWQ